MHGDKPFDEAWMKATFDKYWFATGKPVTQWTNAMLAPPPEHVLNLIGAGNNYGRGEAELRHKVRRIA